jgi:pyruvate, water dikinase
MASSSRNIRWLETIRMEDISLIGGKNASLGELYGELSKVGVKVPNGFALTVAATDATLFGKGMGSPS